MRTNVQTFKMTVGKYITICMNSKACVKVSITLLSRFSYVLFPELIVKMNHGDSVAPHRQSILSFPGWKVMGKLKGKPFVYIDSTSSSLIQLLGSNFVHS